MDQKIVVGGNRAVAVILLFCALMMLPIGIGFVSAYPDEMWWLGLLFLASSALMIYGGISNLKLSSRLARQSEKEVAAISATPAKVSTAKQPSTDPMAVAPKTSEDVAVLARWSYTAEEWKRFIVWETKKRRSNTTVEALLILVLGGLFVNWTRDAGAGIAFAISSVIAVAYWLGKYYLSMKSIGKASGKLNEVIITSHAVIINGAFNAFRSELYWLKKSTLDDSKQPAILEIVYQWNTRGGVTEDEIRVPVPDGKGAEAKAVINALA